MNMNWTHEASTSRDGHLVSSKEGIGFDLNYTATRGFKTFRIVSNICTNILYVYVTKNSDHCENDLDKLRKQNS